VTTTTTAAAVITRRRRIIRKNKICDRCGIERRTMYTRQEPNSSFAWAEPYRDLCPNCYLLEEEKEEAGEKELSGSGG
jgi:hypothetical protein